MINLSLKKLKLIAESRTIKADYKNKSENDFKKNTQRTNTTNKPF